MLSYDGRQRLNKHGNNYYTNARTTMMSAPTQLPLAEGMRSAAATLVNPPSGEAAGQASQWLMRHAAEHTGEVWSTGLALLRDGTCTQAQLHVLLSLLLSLVRQNRLDGAPPPEELVPLVRHWWAAARSAEEVTPTQRQACTLLCALGSRDPHECERLLEWCLCKLDPAQPATALLALQLLQDVTAEILQRPLQSKPLAKLLQEFSEPGAALLEACAHLTMVGTMVRARARGLQGEGEQGPGLGGEPPRLWAPASALARKVAYCAMAGRTAAR